MTIAVLAACFCGASYAQQPSSSSSSSQPPSSSSSQSPSDQALPPAPEPAPDQTPPEEPKKESKIKRKLKDAAPTCIGIAGGAGKCRQSSDPETAEQRKKEAQQQQLHDQCRDAADQPGTPDPACVELHKQDSAHDLEVGDEYFSDKHYPSAENRYRLALQEDPTNATAMLHLAQLLEKMDRKPEAADQYRKFLATNPPEPEASKARKALDKLGK